MPGYLSGVRESLSRLFGRRPPGVSGVVQRGSQAITTAEYLAEANATAYACVSVAARTVAQLPFYSDAEAVDRVLRRPNPAQTGFEFIHSVVWDLLLYGNAFVRVLRNSEGKLIGLYPADPRDVDVMVSDGRVTYRDTARWQGDLDMSDVIHFRDTPGHGLISPSRMAAVRVRLSALDAADRQVAAMFRKGLTLAYVIKSKKQVAAETKADMAQDLADMFGSEESDRVSLVLDNEMEIEQVKAASPTDQDLRSTREDLIREIAGVFGVPPFLVGGTGDTKYNNVSARIASLHRETVVPLVTNLTEKLSARLGVPVRCDDQVLIRGDMAAQVNYATRAAGGPVISPNEARDLLGLARLPGDEYNEVRSSAMPMAPDDGPGSRAGETPTDDGGMENMPEEG